MDISQVIAGAAGLVFVLAAGNYLYRNRHIPDITVPEPKVLRTDLLYGYYGCIENQVEEVKDHTNLYWESQFEGYTVAANNILAAEKFTVLDVMPQLFSRNTANKLFIYNPNGEQNLTTLFDYFRTMGVLRYIKVLYPCDEPNITLENYQDLFTAVQTIQRVAAKYPELEGFKLGVIFAAKPTPYYGAELFDWIGVDDYQFKSQIFVNGTYATIKAFGKKTMIIPGGAFEQDPEPFIRFAHNNPEVAAIIPFVWFGPREPGDKWIGIKDQGIRKQAYIDAGKAICLS